MERPRGEYETMREWADGVLIKRALLTIEHEYGPSGRQPLPYHGPEHTRMVVSSAEMLADAAVAAGRISPAGKPLLRKGGAFHDVVYDPGRRDNEEESALVAARLMTAASVYSHDEISKVVELIMATKVQAIEDGCRIIQSPNDDYLTQLMADADLSSFGQPFDVYWETACRFFAETHPEQPLEGSTLREFAQQQCRVVGQHCYHTEEARRLFCHQPENLARLAALAQAA